MGSCAVYESIVGQKLEGAANCWKYSALGGSRSVLSLTALSPQCVGKLSLTAAMDRQVGECGACVLLQSWSVRRKRVMFSVNMCLLTNMDKGFMYRTVFAKTAFLFATCWIGK